MCSVEFPNDNVSVLENDDSINVEQDGEVTTKRQSGPRSGGP